MRRLTFPATRHSHTNVVTVRLLWISIRIYLVRMDFAFGVTRIDCWAKPYKYVCICCTPTLLTNNVVPEIGATVRQIARCVTRCDADWDNNSYIRTALFPRAAVFIDLALPHVLLTTYRGTYTRVCTYVRTRRTTHFLLVNLWKKIEPYIYTTSTIKRYKRVSYLMNIV